MPQPFFLELSGVSIHRSNLLKLGVEICSYNDHVRLLSPEPVGWIQHHQLYSSVGADIVMESVTLTDPWPILKTCNGVLTTTTATLPRKAKEKPPRGLVATAET